MTTKGSRMTDTPTDDETDVPDWVGEAEGALSFWNNGNGRGRTDPEWVKTSANMLAHALKRAVAETRGK